MKKNKETLKKNYEKACNDYLLAFCEKHEFDYDSCNWIGGYVGGIVEIGDIYAGMEEIFIDIDRDVEESKFMEHYDYSLRCGFLGMENIPNYNSWLKGVPVKSDEELEHLEKLQKNIEVLKSELNEMLKN